jgi:hypothetical protein
LISDLNRFLQKRSGASLNDYERLKLLTNIVINFTQCKLIINNVEIIACKLE